MSTIAAILSADMNYLVRIETRNIKIAILLS